MLRKISTPLLLLLNSMLLVMVLLHDRLHLPVVLQLSARLHPMLVHIPIGFLILALIVRWLRQPLGLREAGVFFDHLFFWTALATVFSALTGCFLGREEGYSGTVLDRHMNLGTALSILTMLISTFREKEKVFNILGAGTVVVVILTGHYGSILTHGENFLSGPQQTNEEVSEPIGDSTSVYQAAVMPVLEKKCISCHNPAKKKGGLDMTSRESLYAGGKHGAILQPGKPSESLLIQRIMLPPGHEDHMPPAGKQQLTSIEIKLFREFIQSGASMELKMGNRMQGDSLRELAWQVATTFSKTEIKSGNTIEPVSAQTIEKLNTVYRNVSLLAADNSGVRVAFYLPAGFTSGSLKDLREIENSIVEMNLSGMPITENDLRDLLNFKNLGTLYLNNTNLDDQGLKILKDLQGLKKLSVSNSKVTSAGLRSIASGTGIKEIFAWNIGSSGKELETLSDNFSNISWVFGEQISAGEILQLTPPLLLNESRILKPGEMIRFKHNLPGVTIRYSLNPNSTPDSVNGKVYTGPLKPGSFTAIKVRAVKEGWKMSSVAEASFFTDGLRPLNAKLLSSPANEYRANGSSTLTDSRAGDQDNHRDGQWLGYRENPMVALFEFEQDNVPESVTVSYLKNPGAYIMPPQKIKIYAGQSQTELKLVAEKTPAQPVGYDRTQVLGESIPLKESFRFLKIEIEPVKVLPKWHGGKGQRAWIFTDEIFFYPAPTI